MKKKCYTCGGKVKFETGGPKNPPKEQLPDNLGPTNFLRSYLNSDQFKKRYQSTNPQGFSNPLWSVENQRQTGNQSLDNLNVSYTDNGSRAYDDNIELDPKQAKKDKANLWNEVYPHEVSHNIRNLSINDEMQFVGRSMNPRLQAGMEHFNPGNTGQTFSNHIKNMNGANHDIAPDENYSDLNALRFLLYKNNIYDTRKGNLTHEQFSKAILNPEIKNSAVYKRLLEHFSNKDIVDLNNTVASNDQQDNTMARKGGKVMYDWGGFSSLKDNPYSQIPGIQAPTGGPSIQSIGYNQGYQPQLQPQLQQGQYKSQNTFDINYNYLAASNTLKAGISYLSQRKKRSEFNDYNRAQQNPLLQLPYNPNTSQQNRTGMEYSRAGGPTFDSRFERGAGWKYYDIGGPTVPPGTGSGPKTYQEDPRYHMADMVNYAVGTGQEPGRMKGVRGIGYSGMPGASQMFTDLQMFNHRTDLQGLNPEQRISRYYDTISNNQDVQDLKMKLKSLGQGPTTLWENTSDGNTQDFKKAIKFDQGGPNQQNPKQNNRPTTADSLALYNNAKQVAAYYNNPDYKLIKTQKEPGDTAGVNTYNQNVYEWFTGKADVAGEPYGLPYRKTINVDKDKDYRKIINNNQYYQRENADVILDMNAPMTLFDKRISPQSYSQYQNVGNTSLRGDGITTYQYDPIAVKPWNMLTDSERKIRIQKYGYPDNYTKGFPQTGPNELSVPKPVPKPIPPRPYGTATVQPEQTNQPNINVHPQPFNMPQPPETGLTYNDIPPGPYNPNKGQVVYKGNKLVGYTDEKGNPVDGSYFGVIDPNKKAFGGLLYKDSTFKQGDGKEYYDNGGYVDFEDEFEKDLTEDPQPIQETPVQLEEQPVDQTEEEKGLSESFKNDQDEDIVPSKSSADRLAFLYGDDNLPTGVPVDDISMGDPHIGKIESGNNYTAFNPAGGGQGAVGKYQFRWNIHKDAIAAVTGVKDKNEFLHNPYAQEKYFKNWDDNVLTPQANNLLPIAQLKNPNTTLEDVKKQIHFAGPAGAAAYYKQGKVTKDAMGTTNDTYGKYKLGGEVEVSEDELNDLIAKGYKFDII